MAGYLASLEMVGTMGAIDALHLPRIAQLGNKSNQFHLTGSRLTEREIERLSGRGEVETVHVRLRDRCGDNALIEGVVLRKDRARLHVDTRVQSCGASGRTVEDFSPYALGPGGGRAGRWG